VSEIESKERELEFRKEKLLREVRRERLSELMKEFKVITFEASNVWKKNEKCSKCNDKRQIEFMSPSGKPMNEPCECNKSYPHYEPEEKVCIEFRINSTKKDCLSVWYKEHKDRDYDWYGYESSRYVDEFYSDDMKYEDIDKFKVFFKNKEDCQKYCDWLNDNK
jgi:hypothetical protein